MRNALEQDRARLVILAADAGRSTAKTFCQLSERRGTCLKTLSHRGELGALLGRNQVAVLAVLDRNLAEGLISVINRESGGVS